MKKAVLILAVAVAPFVSAARALDWPVTLNFQPGFTISAVPAPDDASRDLGLVVAAERFYSDKVHSLVITGSIVNMSDVPRDSITMRFTVTSYIGTTPSFGRATIEPNCLPPGGIAAFSAIIPLNSEKPQYARYTVTAGE